MTKIDIISGFLGAGKTTLIKKLIEEVFAGEKLVLIENEFGEISIDGGFLKESGIQISEMSSGCICCSLVGDFSKALKEVVAEYHPDRVLIEPSGVGKLSDVIAAVQRTVAEFPEMELNSFVTVADASKVKVYMKNFGEFYNNQVESAGAILLSRTQKVSQEKLDTAISLIRTKNPNAAILTTPWDQLSSEAILNAIEGNSLADELLEKINAAAAEHGQDGCHHHHHHADEVFSSWGAETPRTFSQEEIERILTALDSGEYGQIVRAKGIVGCPDSSWLEFDYVPEEHDIRDGHPDYTGRLCVIGSGLDEDKLSDLFSL